MTPTDELREKARLLRGYVDGLNAPYVIPSTKELMALTMLDSADRMEQAADTILELREMAQKANAENAKLRELCSALYEFAYDEYPDSAELNFADRMRKLRIEVEHD